MLLVLIGRQWATLADEDGHRRLDDPDDLVRFEVQSALERGVRVIPVLVDGTRPLRQQQLPHELHKLARLNAFELSYERYQFDAERLLELIQRVLPKPLLPSRPPLNLVGSSLSLPGLSPREGRAQVRVVMRPRSVNMLSITSAG